MFQLNNDTSRHVQAEMKRQEEREVSAQAAEEIDRVALGERLRECEIANSIRGEPFGRDRRFNRYYWCASYIAHL